MVVTFPHPGYTLTTAISTTEVMNVKLFSPETLVMYQPSPNLINKIENLLGPPNGCFSVLSESMSITGLQTYGVLANLKTKKIVTDKLTS